MHFLVNSHEKSSVHGHELFKINPLNAELNPTCHLLALLGTRHFFQVSKVRVKLLIPTPQKTIRLHYED